MRVLALGCAGGMGSVAVHAAMDYEAVKEIVIADLNEESAMALAEQLGDKAQAIRLDVTDSEALGAAIENSDVVVSQFSRALLSIRRASPQSGNRCQAALRGHLR